MSVPLTAPPMEFSGNQPLWLSDPATAWSIEGGSAGVFVTERSEPAAAAVCGVRRFLFVLGPGAIAPPAVAAEGNWQLMLLPLEVSAIRPVPQAVALATGDFNDAIRSWIDSLGRVVAEWPGLPESAFERPAGESPAHALERITALFYATWPELENQRAEADSQRFEERRRVDDAMAARAMEHLSGAAVRRPAIVHRDGSPLLLALRAVGQAQGIAVRAGVEDGTRQDQLSSIAQRSGFRTRLVVFSGAWWRNENGPMLAFRKQDRQPVALLPTPAGLFHGTRYDLFDPETGTRTPVDPQVAFEIDPRGYVLYRPFPQNLSTISLIRFALAGNPRDLLTLAITGVAAILLGFVAPQATGMLIDQAIPDADRNMVWQVAGAMFASATGAMLFLLTQSLATLRVQSALYSELQAGVWDFVLRLGPAFFRRFTAGELSLRVNALTRMEQLISTEALRSLFAGCTSTLTLLLMFWYSFPLGMIALVSGALVVGWLWVKLRRLAHLQDSVQDVDELLSGVVLQLVNAVTKLRVAGAERRAFAYWASEYGRKQALSLQVQAIKDQVRLVNLTVPVVALAASYLYMQPTGAGSAPPLPLGTFLAYIAAQTIFLTSLTQAADILAGLVLAHSLWQRTRSILDERPEVDSTKTATGRLRGRINVEHVTFRYRQDGPLTLDDVTIHAEPGECIALTGPSGSGKSTILNLLLRFETPSSGGVYLDGQEISSLDIVAVRRQIGVVTQDGKLMSGSIFENIASGGFCSMDDAWDAARAAGFAEDIEAMPMGMHTVISEGGGNISGGQRQRLLIARALVRRPSIVVFDEATSALDNRSQAIVTDSLDRLRATRILVAHRLSTIRHADRIYVIDAGRVIQSGTYAELSAQEGLFSRLVERQSA